nr:hypothetical protein [Tanacetum cinerariifolium]
MSLDRVFDYPKDELEPHPAYDFFTPALLPGYAGEQMVVLAIEEVVEAAKEQVIAPVADMEEGQMDVSMIDMEEDLAMLFGEDDDFENDSRGVDEKEAWEVTEEWLMAPVTSPPVPAVQPSNVYEVGGNLEYGHGQLVQRINQGSNAETAASVTIRELGLRIYVVKG